MTEKECKIAEDPKHHFNKKLVWMFAFLHEGEEEALLWAHKELKLYPHAVTLMVPRHPYQCQRIVHVNSVVGGSFLLGLTGHNISEVAAAGCAILTGPYVGHFSQVISKMKPLNHLSVQQVSGKLELVEILKDLLSNVEALGMLQSRHSWLCQVA